MAAEMVPNNQDGANVVDALGPGTEGLTVGDRDWVGPPAQHSSSRRCRPDRVSRLPDGASIELGADLGVPATVMVMRAQNSLPLRASPGRAEAYGQTTGNRG